MTEFPKGKEAYCPECYFVDDKVVLREDCPGHKRSEQPEQRTVESQTTTDALTEEHIQT